jgi:hypothetical protein
MAWCHPPTKNSCYRLIMNYKEVDVKKLNNNFFKLGWICLLFFIPTAASGIEADNESAAGDKWAQSNHELLFESYAVSIYEGRQITPKGIRQVGSYEWRNENGKLVGAPEINFAGKYNITLHSCGTGCRYYQMTDMSNGKDVPILGMFSTAEPPPLTKSGKEYLTVLLHVANSKLLVAQYHIDPYGSLDRTECREKSYVFENGRLKSNSRTKIGCTEFKEFK